MTIQEIRNILKNDDVPASLMEEILSDERKGVEQAVVSYMNRLRRESEERLRVESMYEKESEFYKKGINLIAGIDEVGRGPLAGPVTVAAVILPAHWFASGLNDSKKVTPRHREELSRKIRDAAVDYSIVSMSPEEIDSILRRIGMSDRKVSVNFTTGDRVKILTGPFSGIEGSIDAMNDDTQTATVLCILFGRETPTEIAYNDLEKVEL